MDNCEAQRNRSIERSPFGRKDNLFYDEILRKVKGASTLNIGDNITKTRSTQKRELLLKLWKTPGAQLSQSGSFLGKGVMAKQLTHEIVMESHDFDQITARDDI